MHTSHTTQQLSEQTYFILLSVASAPKHGYAIAKDVQLISRGRVTLSISTLYTTLKRLLEDGWIKLSGTTQAVSKRPRKTYELTGLGRRVLASEVDRLEMLVSASKAQKTAHAP